jgi:hypothetical protein
LDWLKAGADLPRVALGRVKGMKLDRGWGCLGSSSQDRCALLACHWGVGLLINIAIMGVVLLPRWPDFVFQAKSPAAMDESLPTLCTRPCCLGLLRVQSALVLFRGSPVELLQPQGG